MSSIETGDWMVSKTNPSVYLEVVDTTPDGGVTVLLDGIRINTTKQYLLAQWCHLEGDA
ncbi:hypothetical protein [Curtobacterium sp. MCBD17_030]|uniref:hypothetical protein n=1 Tax=Curtobacterium sp. MCBD17_030 TaxID=2175649 RepID=UPI0015E8B1E4|nr:hypothetical protein [Curtobacterium sp. MCBD17_030]